MRLTSFLVCLCLCSCSETGASDTPSSIADASSADAVAPDADQGVPCQASTSSAEMAGSYWAAFVSIGTPNHPDEMWAVRVEEGVPGPAIKLNGPIIDGGTVVGSPTDLALPFVWAPSGQSLAYLAHQEDRLIAELYVVDMAGAVPGSASKVNGPMVPGGGVFAYAFSPDSTKLAYVAEENLDNLRELFVVDMTAGTLVPQRVNGAFSSIDSDVQGFAWSSDSKHLAYVANEDSVDQLDLYVSDVSSSQPSAREKLTSLQADDHLSPSLHWSPSGSRLAFLVDTASGGELRVVDIELGQVSTSTGPMPIGRDPSWTPDGSHIIYERANHIFALDLSSSSELLLSGSLSTNAMSYQVAPDSNSIALLPSVQKLHWGPTESSTEPALLGEALTTFSYAWIPDSSGIIFRATSTRSGGTRLYLGREDASVRELSEVAMPTTRQVRAKVGVSLDGRRVSFLADPESEGLYELFLADLLCPDAGIQRVNAEITPGLSPPDGEIYDHVWSGDSSMLMYNGSQDVPDRADLYLVDVSAAAVTAPTRMNLNLPESRGVSYFQWSPSSL